MNIQMVVNVSLYFAFSFFQNPWSVIGPAILRKPSLHTCRRGMRSAPMEVDMGVTRCWAKNASHYDLVQYLEGEKAGSQNICW